MEFHSKSSLSYNSRIALFDLWYTHDSHRCLHCTAIRNGHNESHTKQTLGTEVCLHWNSKSGCSSVDSARLTGNSKDCHAQAFSKCRRALSSSIYNSAICCAAIFDFRYFRFCSLFTLVNFGIFHQPFAIREWHQFIAYQLHTSFGGWSNGLSCLCGHICICSREKTLSTKGVEPRSHIPQEQERASPKRALRALLQARDWSKAAFEVKSRFKWI